jgi:hypothetical protein
MRNVSKKAAGGGPYDRDVLNDGNSFPLSWTGRPWKCIQRVQRVYQQFKRGYFTFIDWEGGAREYVGRITQMPEETRSRNNSFSLSGVIFTEIPGCPMRVWPQDWEGDGAWLYPLNGWGDQDIATQGSWDKTARGSDYDAFTPMDNAGMAGDWAQYEYCGYGFQLSLMKGPGFGIADVYLDDVQIQTVDLYSAVDHPEIVIEQPEVSLDFHRVKVVLTGNKNAAAAAAGVSWHALRVIP